MGPRPGPYDGMTDEQVLARGRAALRLVQAAGVGSVGRAIQWAVYEDARAELNRRLYAHVAGRMRERSGHQRAPGESPEAQSP
jgi:hypothetical protein